MASIWFIPEFNIPWATRREESEHLPESTPCDEEQTNVELSCRAPCSYPKTSQKTACWGLRVKLGGRPLTYHAQVQSPEPQKPKQTQDIMTNWKQNAKHSWGGRLNRLSSLSWPIRQVHPSPQEGVAVGVKDEPSLWCREWKSLLKLRGVCVWVKVYPKLP